MAGEVAAHAAEGLGLIHVVGLLAAGVVAVPIFRRLGLGSVLGYLAAGLAVGPYGFRLVTEPEAILHAAELGVVMFLFIIGLEMEPSRLWSLRKQIFGLGALQVLACGALLTVVGVLVGFPPVAAFVAGMGFVLTSTAIVMQVMQEEGTLATEPGQKIVSILLLEDLAIVPLLAVVALLAPAGTGEETTMAGRWIGIGVALAAVVGLIFVGRYILNPLFKVLADSRAREVMTGAALLVVLGAALAMSSVGLSMAMGAFLAGVLLSTSTFKHQLEADVEPFRGLLLGLFFLAVGMSLDLGVIAANWQTVAIAVVAYMIVKGVAIYLIARVLGSGHAVALERAVLMAQGGEFAFVLYTTALAGGIFTPEQSAMFTATVIISMVLTPITVLIMRQVLPEAKPSMEGVELVQDLRAQVLIIGFGRFGQISAQPLIAKGYRVSIIDNDTDMIRAAARFRMKVYYGDGTRLDILHSAGAGVADLVLVCVDKVEQSNKIVELLRSEFPLVKVMARAFDRRHAFELIKAGVDFQVREVFESALVFGSEALKTLGVDPDEVPEVIEGVRERDRLRFEAQLLGGLTAAPSDLLLSNAEDQARETGVVGAPSEPVMLEKPKPDAEEQTPS